MPSTSSPRRASFADFLLFLVDHGITTIDTADVYGRYGVENYLGAALKLMGAAKKKLQIDHQGRHLQHE